LNIFYDLTSSASPRFFNGNGCGTARWGSRIRAFLFWTRIARRGSINHGIIVVLKVILIKWSRAHSSLRVSWPRDAKDFIILIALPLNDGNVIVV
jgi:hypothetical protein